MYGKWLSLVPAILALRPVNIHIIEYSLIWTCDWAVKRTKYVQITLNFDHILTFSFIAKGYHK